MYKNKFDELVKSGVISQLEKKKIYSQMKPNSDGQLIGRSDIKIDYKYRIGGDIFNENLCDFVIKYCVPPLGMEDIDNTFKIYGMSVCGICDKWHWFTRDNINQYAIEKGHKPIEYATNEELWKMLAMSSMYWEGSYKEWCDKSEQKSTILDEFIGDCEREYFGYDDDGYTINTIKRILDSIKKILERKDYKNEI